MRRCVVAPMHLVVLDLDGTLTRTCAVDEACYVRAIVEERRVPLSAMRLGSLVVGIVAGERVRGADRPAVVHNIDAGARTEDVLRSFEIIGHYRW